MARKKVILREQILEAAYEIVTTTNFSALTARHVADRLQCSTQPIYLEFHNMADLKYVVYEKMKAELQLWFSKKHDFYKDPVINLCLSYIEFSTVRNEIHRALANDNFGSSRDFKYFIYEEFSQQMEEFDEYKDLTENDKQRLVSVMWQFTIGIASTILNGLMTFDITKISQAFEQQLHWIMNNREFPTLM